MPDHAERWRTISARNLARFWESLSHGAPQQRTAHWDNAWATDAASPTPFANSATLQRPLQTSEAGALVDRLGAFYQQEQGGPWMLWDPWQMPDLAPQGLQLAGHPPLMVRPAGGSLPAAPPELIITEVVDDTGLQVFEATFIGGYPVPELQPAGSQRFIYSAALGGPLRFWIGSVAEEPVAVSAAYIGEEAVSVFMVATLPHVRGKGYGAALTVRAVQAAPTLPAELQSSDDGRPVYLRLGFQIVSSYSLWFAPRHARPS